MTYDETILTNGDTDKAICLTGNEEKVNTTIPFQEQLVGYTLQYLLELITKEQYISSIKALNALFEMNQSDLKKRRQRNLSGKDVQVWYLEPSFYLEEQRRGLEHLLSFGKIELEEYKACTVELTKQLFALIPLKQTTGN